MPKRVPSYRPASGIPTQRIDARRTDTKAFYNSKAWCGPQGARQQKLRQDPLCERCKREGRYVPATHVHHKVEVRDDPGRALDIENLESLCTPCHSRIHAYGRKEHHHTP